MDFKVVLNGLIWEFCFQVISHQIGCPSNRLICITILTRFSSLTESHISLRVHIESHASEEESDGWDSEKEQKGGGLENFHGCSFSFTQL